MKILPVEAELFHAGGQTWRSFSQFSERAYKNITVSCESLFVTSLQVLSPKT